ncbi:MAG: ExeM/NucH family extracellular endonuclease, partial [Specibacter sp.]
MTSNTLMKTGLSAILALGLVGAPLALAPAMADQPSATADPTSTAALTPTGALAPAVTAAASHVIINEAYLNGGSTGASYKNRFVELYNPTDADISLKGWSLQYRPGANSGAISVSTALDGTTGVIPAKGYYLVKGAANGGATPAGDDLPAADVESASLAFAAGTGTIVLSNQAAKFPSLPTGSVVGQDGVVDLLGYGTSNTFEGALAPIGSVSKSLNRTNFADTDSNVADFTTAAPTPIGTQGGAIPPSPPADSGTKTIAEIQGTGAASPIADTTVTTKGKVTAVYPDGGFNGYFIQTPGTGGDLDLGTHGASDGVFVYSPSTVRTVKVGDYVQVKGLVTEFGAAADTNKTTEINVASGDMTVLADPAPEVKATVLKTLPATDAQRETLEGMLVAPQGTFTITDNYSLSSYGEVGMAAGTTPLVQPTAVAPYGSTAYTAQLAENAARAIKIDDGASTNYSTTGSAIPLPWLSAGTPMRVGSQGEFASNVIFDNRNNAYKFQPLAPLTVADAATVQPIAFGNTRAAAPNNVGGNLKIASFNVQNYFPTTGDADPACQFYTDREGNPLTVKGGCLQRGAANAANLKRQQDKIVSGINASGADVLSLEEIENSAKFGKDRDNALSILVAALNAAAPGTWDYVRSPATRPALTDEDVIRTAFIFKKAVAEPVGNSVILDDAAFTGIARQPLAQAFKRAGAPDASKMLLIVNHFKSKGSAIG